MLDICGADPTPEPLWGSWADCSPTLRVTVGKLSHLPSGEVVGVGPAKAWVEGVTPGSLRSQARGVGGG